MGNLVFTSVSPWYFLLCLLAGTGYAAFLYLRDSVFSPPVKLVLAFMRMLVVALLLALLLDPLVKSTAVENEKPVIILAQDRSASIGLVPVNAARKAAYEESMKKLEQQLAVNYQVKSYSFGSGVEDGLDFRYTGKATDFSALFDELSRRYENQNLGAVILASDGIYNRGADPLSLVKNLQVPVYTIALGDTLQHKDQAIEDVVCNNLVYEGDKFRLQINISAHQLEGKISRLVVSAGGKIISTTTIPIKTADFSAQIPLSLDAGTPGFRKITVSLVPLPGESSTVNNSRSLVVEVIKGKLKILLLAAAPDPDLSALKQALESYRNDIVELKVTGDATGIVTTGYDLLVLDQLPARQSGGGWAKLTGSKLPRWFIAGNQTDIAQFNAVQKDIQLNPAAGLVTELPAELAPAFSAFTLSDSLKKALSHFSPLLGSRSFQLSGPAQVILQTGSGKAAIPLLFLSGQEAEKTAWQMGTGIWRWRLEDYQANGSHKLTDEFFGKLVQYLTAKDDKSRFRISMPRHILNEDEPLIFNAVLFNESYEPVTTTDISLELTDGRGKVYRFTFNKNDSGYSLDAGTLPAGDYTWHSAVQSGTRKLESTGVFMVKALQLENMNLTANHNLLYQLAHRTGGVMVDPAAISGLPALLEKNEVIKTQSHELRTVKELISVRLIAGLLFLLLVLEWGIRKWNGVY